MKKAKKIVSLMLALVMVLSMAITVFAEDSATEIPKSYTITVTDVTKGEIYEIYKMLDLSVDNAEDPKAFSYTVDEDWEAFFTGEGAGAAYVDINNGYVTWKEDKGTAGEMEAFGKAAQKYAEENSVTPEKTITAGEATSITFEDLKAGYYLITSTAGTKAIVDTTPTKPNPTIKEKNEGHIVDKFVQEDSKIDDEKTNGWGKENSAEIGQQVNFKTEITIKTGAKKLVMHDRMEDGLTFNEDSVVVTGLNGELVKDTDYELVTDGLTAEEDGKTCTFEVRFTQAYLDSLQSDTTVFVTYSAVLNEKADKVNGEHNDAGLTWGENSKTEWIETTTKTYQFELLKYDGKDEGKKPLAGAKFELHRGDANDCSVGCTPIGLVEVEENESYVVYRLATENDPKEKVSTTIVTRDKKIMIYGLDLNDEYHLKEVKAPEGYNLLKDSVSVVIKTDDDGKVIECRLEVANNSGTELPSTGGIGTTVFYVVGSVLVCAAVVLLITRKRMSINE